MRGCFHQCRMCYRARDTAAAGHSERWPMALHLLMQKSSASSSTTIACNEKMGDALSGRCWTKRSCMSTSRWRRRRNGPGRFFNTFVVRNSTPGSVKVRRTLRQAVFWLPYRHLDAWSGPFSGMYTTETEDQPLGKSVPVECVNRNSLMNNMQCRADAMIECI